METEAFVVVLWMFYRVVDVLLFSRFGRSSNGRANKSVSKSKPKLDNDSRGNRKTSGVKG